jgi:hypothetical protein
MILVEDAKPSDRVTAPTALRGELLKGHFVGFNGIFGYMSLEGGRDSKVKLTLIIHLFWRRLGRFFNVTIDQCRESRGFYNK